jgi:hypothetical protein
MFFGATTFAEDSFSAEGSKSIVVALSGQQISTAIGNVVIESKYPVTGEAVVTTQGTLTATGTAVVTVTGQDLSFTIGTYSVTADGNTSIIVGPEHEIDTAIGTPTVTGSAVVSVTGQSLTTTQNSVVASGAATVLVTGVSARFNDLARFSYSLDSQTVGFPVLSNTESKTGTTSAYFGSTNNEIQIPQEQDVIQSALSANNQFTIEFWYYVETATFAPRLISVQQNNNISTRQLHIVPFQGKIRVSNQQGTLIDSAGSVSNQTWTHIALTADNGTLKLYIDGVLEGTSTGTTFIDAQSEFNIGGTGPFGSTDGRFHLDGYMDLFRVSNSVRYTTNFTPPTSAFTVDDNTTIIFNFDGPNGSQDFELLQLPYSSTDIVADANVDVTGEELTTTIGQATATGTAVVQLTGIGLTTTIGQATATVSAEVPVTGQSLSTATGSVTVFGTAVVTPTGIELTVVQRSVGVVAWANVDDSNSNTWTPVDDSITNLWTPVDDSATNTWTPVDDSITNLWTPVDDSATNTWTEVDDREVA